MRLLPAAGSAAGSLSFLPLFFVFLTLFCVGCTSVPAGRSAVKSVELTGNDAIDADDLREKIATADSPKFLGFFQGVVYDWNVFDRFVLERDLQRIERYYRARGYYHARVRAGRVFFVANNKVRVDIIIEEGEKMLVARVDLHGLDVMDRKLLEAVIHRFDGGPVGLDNVAAAIGEERDTIEDVIEPYLIQQGYLLRTPRGRMAGKLAYEHYGLKPPRTADPDLFNSSD